MAEPVTKFKPSYILKHLPTTTTSVTATPRQIFSTTQGSRDEVLVNDSLDAGSHISMNFDNIMSHQLLPVASSPGPGGTDSTVTQKRDLK